MDLTGPFRPAYVWWKSTSVEGYLHFIGTKKAGSIRERVYRSIWGSMPDGITRSEMYEGPMKGMKWGTMTARVWELLQLSPAVVSEGPDKRGCPRGYVLRVIERDAQMEIPWIDGDSSSS